MRLREFRAGEEIVAAQFAVVIVVAGGRGRAPRWTAG
jgi:hypothetical protein